DAELPRTRCGGGQGEGLDRVGRAQRPRFQVELVEGHAFDVGAEEPERVHVAMAGAHPVDELDAHLERALDVAHEVVLVDAQELEEIADRRDGRLADAHRADLLRLDEVHRGVAVPQEARAGRGRHPARRAAADDDDPADAPVAAHSAVSSRNAATHTSGAFQLIAASFGEYAWSSSAQQVCGAQPFETSIRATSSAGLVAFGPPERTPGGGEGSASFSECAQKR